MAAMLFAGSLAALLVFAIALIGLILGAIAVDKLGSYKTLDYPKLLQPTLVGATPTIAIVPLTGVVLSNPSLGPESNDSSGSIFGTLTGLVSPGDVQVKFATPYKTTPTSVQLTPACFEMVDGNTLFFVRNVTAEHFTIGFNTGTGYTSFTGKVLYYLVL